MLKTEFDLRFNPAPFGFGFPLEKQDSSREQPAVASRVGEVRAVRNVRGHRRAPGQPAVAPPTATGPPGGRSPQRLGAVPKRHQAGAPDTQTPTAIAPL